MTKKSDYLTVGVGDKVYRSRPSPEPDGVADNNLDCPACGSARYEHVVTVVQHGFVVDDCLSLVHCRSCGETFHYRYTVEGMYAVLKTYP